MRLLALSPAESINDKKERETDEGETKTKTE